MWNCGEDRSTDISKWFKDPETGQSNCCGIGNLPCKVAHHKCYTSEQTDPAGKPFGLPMKQTPAPCFECTVLSLWHGFECCGV